MTRCLFAVLVLALPLAAQDDPVKALKAMEGKYTLASFTIAGKPVAKPDKERETFVIRGGNLVAVSQDGKKEDALAMKLSGANVDFTEPGKAGGPHMLGVYKFDGKMLTFCIAESNKPDDRPKDITATGERVLTVVLEKLDEKPKDPKDKK